MQIISKFFSKPHLIWSSESFSPKITGSDGGGKKKGKRSSSENSKNQKRGSRSRKRKKAAEPSFEEVC